MSVHAVKVLNKSIVKFVEDVQTSTLEKVSEFVMQYVSDKDTFSSAFEEFKKNLKHSCQATFTEACHGKKNSGGLRDKKKRPASAYNLFIGEKIKELKLGNKTDNGKDLMKKAIELWKEHKKIT